MAGRCGNLFWRWPGMSHELPLPADAADVPGATDGRQLSHCRHHGTNSRDSQNSQWALFLRNHDELGLEMVTEEEKDYLFKAYANDADTKFNVGIRRRLAPLMNNDRRKIGVASLDPVFAAWNAGALLRR